jgi:hypothetical protein
VLAVESVVVDDARVCPFCNEAIRDHPALALTDTGALRWAHQLCAIRVSGRRMSAMVPGARTAGA